MAASVRRTSGNTAPLASEAVLSAATDCEKPLRSSTVPADRVTVLLVDKLLACAMSILPPCNKVAPE